jgi:hypothetical protein
MALSSQTMGRVLCLGMSAYTRDHYDYCATGPCQLGCCIPVYHQWHRTKCAPWWFYHLAVTLPGAADNYIEKEIDTFVEHVVYSLNSTRQALTLLMDETTHIRKVVLQNHMALDLLTASQGGNLCTTAYQTLCIYL